MSHVSPATDVGRAKGKSTAASINLFPGKLYRTNVQAKIKPKKALNKQAIKAIQKVTLYADKATGWVANCQNLVNKVSLAVVNSESIGTSNRNIIYESIKTQSQAFLKTKVVKKENQA